MGTGGQIRHEFHFLWFDIPTQLFIVDITRIITFISKHNVKTFVAPFFLLAGRPATVQVRQASNLSEVLIRENRSSGRIRLNTFSDFVRRFSEILFVAHGVLTDWLSVNRGISERFQAKKLLFAATLSASDSYAVNEVKRKKILEWNGPVVRGGHRKLWRRQFYKRTHE